MSRFQDSQSFPIHLPGRFSWLTAALIGVPLILAARAVPAAEPEEVSAAIARVPRPWTAQPNRFTLAEYEETLRWWAEKHQGVFQFERRGATVEGLPVHLVKITDPAVPDAEKQRCLITALHSGPERSGTTTILHFVEWLLGDDPLAVETRRKQLVLLMPIVNPYSFFVKEASGNSQGIGLYDGGRGKWWDVPNLKYLAAEKSPEIAAFLSVIDEFRPEVHADIHGISLAYNGQLVFETVGSAGSNFSMRPWDWRVSEAMIAAAQAEGYGADRWEADAQRMLAGPALEPQADKLWMGRGYFYNGTYAYMKYHTMLVLTENGWEQGGTARLKGLMRIGNDVWAGEPAPGYPVDRVKTQFGRFLVAWGRNAAERRASRVELWNRQANLTLAGLYPETDGRMLWACELTARGATLLDEKPANFVANLKTMPQFGGEAIEAFLKAGPETKLYVDRVAHAEPRGLEHGLALRLRLSYRNPEVLDLRLNGHALRESAIDGFQKWFADGFTQVQVNIPPEKTRDAGLFVVTCAFKPDVQRTYGWRPPKEVLERLKAKAK